MWKHGVLAVGGLLLSAQEARFLGPMVRDPNGSLLLGRAVQVKADTLRNLPSATVEVTGVGERDAEHIRALTFWMTPTLQASALLGYGQRESVQMLAEFMAMDPSKPHPPTLPAFWNNAQRPTTLGEEFVSSWKVSPRARLSVGTR